MQVEHNYVIMNFLLWLFQVRFGFRTSPNPNRTEGPVQGSAKKAKNWTEPDFDSTSLKHSKSMLLIRHFNRCCPSAISPMWPIAHLPAFKLYVADKRQQWKSFLGAMAHNWTTSQVTYHPQTDFFLSNGPQTDSGLGDSILAQDRQQLG